MARRGLPSRKRVARSSPPPPPSSQSPPSSRQQRGKSLFASSPKSSSPSPSPSTILKKERKSRENNRPSTPPPQPALLEGNDGKGHSSKDVDSDSTDTTKSKGESCAQQSESQARSVSPVTLATIPAASSSSLTTITTKGTKTTTNTKDQILSSKKLVNAEPSHIQGTQSSSSSTSSSASSASVSSSTAAIENPNSELSSTQNGNNVTTPSSNNAPTEVSTTAANPSSPRTQPKFHVKQKVLARDTSTFLLYGAVVRKMMYGPRSRDVKISPEDESNKDGAEVGGEQPPLEDDDEDELENFSNYCWHYFLHYMQWNVKWDLWVDERYLYNDNESGQIFMKLVKKESKVPKKVSMGMAFHKRMTMLDAQFREKEDNIEEVTKWLTTITPNREKEESSKKSGADNSPTHPACDDTNSNNDASSLRTLALTSQQNKKRKRNTPEFTKAFVQRESKLRTQYLRSRKPQFCAALNLPFTIKQVLTNEWEIISQCSMVHKLPASITVAGVLSEYLQGKIRVLRADTQTTNRATDVAIDSNMEDTSTTASMEQNNAKSSVDASIATSMVKGDANTSAATPTADPISSSPLPTLHKGTTSNILNPNTPQEQEWKDMTDGLLLYFDQALPVQLLYDQEIPQRRHLKTSFPNRRYCELYPCEHLLRLLLCLPELLAGSASASSDKASNSSHIAVLSKEEKSKILFKVGDLVRFLQKYQNIYLLQCFRRPNLEEVAKAPRRMRQQSGNNVSDVDENGNFCSSSMLDIRKSITAGSSENYSEVDARSVGTAVVTVGGGGRKRKTQASGKTRKCPVNPIYCNL